MKIIYIVPVLIGLVSYFIIKKYYTNEDCQSASRPCSKETIIDRATAIKLFDTMKNSEVLGATLGADVDGPQEYREKLLCIGFAPLKEFEINGNKELNYSWFIAITWLWAMYDTDKRDERGIPQELCSMAADDVAKIEKHIPILEGKKLTSVTLNSNAIELIFEHIMILIMMPEEDDVTVCCLCTPDDDALEISRDKIILKTN